MSDPKPQLICRIDGAYYDLTLAQALVLSVQKQGAPRAYLVRKAESGRWECDCTGYRYRHRCKHVRALAEVGIFTLLEAAAHAEATDTVGGADDDLPRAGVADGGAGGGLAGHR